MDIVAEARAALEEYRTTGKMPVLPQCDNIQHVSGVWKCVFEEEPNLDAWECLAIQENDQLLDECNKDDEKLFPIQALLALSCIRTYSPSNLSGGFISGERLAQWKQLFKQLQPKIAKAWAEAFNHPKFSELVIEKSNLFSCLTRDDLAPFEHRMNRPCGNSECRTSTGIHEGITFGSGELDQYGFWEVPCEVCARAYDQKSAGQLEEFIQEQMAKGKTRPEAVSFLKEQHQWLFIEAWPFPESEN